MLEHNKKLVDEFIAYSTNIKGRAVNTVNAYESDLTAFCEAVDIDVTDITKSEIEDYIAALKANGNSASSANRKLSSIKAFYKYLKGHNVIQVDPAETVDSAKVEKKAPKAITGDELARLIETVDRLTVEDNRHKTGKNLRRRYKAILYIFLNCGLRKSELVNLQLDDVDFANAKLLIHGKGAKQRYVYMSDKTMATLKSYLEIRNELKGATNSTFVFLTGSGSEKMAVSDINRYVDRLFKEAGLDGKGYVVHTLRKTAATALHRNGIDIYTIKEILGHDNINTTTIYLAASERTKQAAMRTMVI